ncbi:ABC transporter permease [Sinimarinibacterium flocculans]|uniref:Putative ABC transport system permease protein n=1 Tax=Sinimarinibacterium flocculans TaxID=985250 RepID=A0A318E4N5_9GAMM|nr:ABC transporter permease [Sinimarinibacterium flocculans]PXV65326.1 putative ABC transport system permease protein [Sinimarinibacterium flocculans]
MTWLRLALANLRAAPLTSLVNAALLALGTASIVLLLLIGEQFSSTLARDARSIDLVVGAKGSPVQLVLSSVYHADVPTGNIVKADADRWAADPRVAHAVPLSLGDSYRGFRIVGTTTDYPALYAAQLASGRFWEAPMEAVAGAAAAREAGLVQDRRFAGAHGLVDGGHEHAGQPYRIVGVLQPTGTVLDRLILTSLDSVWNLHGEHESAHDNHEHDHDQNPEDEHDHGEAHEHDHADAHDDARENTSMLIRYASPLAATTLPRQINTESQLQAAAPAFEVTRLLNLVGLGLDGLRAFAGVLILTAGFSVFAALYGALKARRYDLAMLRCLGATRTELLWSLLLEGLMLAALGAVLGLALGHGTMELIGRWLAASRGVSATGWVWLPTESWLLLGLLVIGVLAAALPAWQAYRADVARTLAG